MCRDNDHGGRRCPENDSTGRRLRRKQADAREKYPSVPPSPGNQNPVPVPETATFTEAKTAVEAFRTRLNEPRPEGITEAEWDASLEQELVEVGYKLDACVEEEAGDGIVYDTDHFNDYWDAQYQQLIDEVPSEKKARYFEIQAVIAERRDNINRGLQDPDKSDEAYDDLIEELDSLDTSWQRESVDEADRRLAEYRKQVERDRVTAYAEASKKLIASIRPVGGNLDGLEDAPAGIKEAFEETVMRHYPSEWISQSNKVGPVKYEVQPDGEIGGNHKVAATGEDTGSFRQVSNKIDFYANEFSRELWDSHWEEISQIPGVTRTKVFIRAMKDSETYVLHTPEEEVFDPKVHGAPMAGKPTGKGWEKRPTLYGFAETAMVKEDATDAEKSEYIKKALAPRWVRSKTTSLSDEVTITIPDVQEHEPAMRNAILGIAYHEYGHRVENTLRGGLLPRMEKAFLERRATDDVHNLSPMVVGYIRQAGFVDQYMGRVYPGRENYEIFTTGIQAVYGKSYGGLRGLSKDFRRADAEHRAFTLGCLASL